ncbi:MAG: hypothetical protein AB7I38_15170 [Dehalococcoidia bacterium]
MSGETDHETGSHAERLFREDLAGGAFAAGEDRGMWRLDLIAWPRAVIEVAAPPRPGGPEWFALRFELSAYPGAPSAQPWDPVADDALPSARWPDGNERLRLAFRPDWRLDALYIPLDRLALESHPNWSTEYPASIWDPHGGIVQYLRFVYDLLNGAGYSGVRG